MNHGLHDDSSDDDLPALERRRIIAEEEFRRTVATKFVVEPRSLGARLAKALNSALAVALVSTFGLGLITWAYQRREDKQHAKRERAEHEAHNSAELLYRLSACDRINASSNRDDVESLLNSVVAVRPLYREYQSRQLSDVYMEFCELSKRCPVNPASVMDISKAIFDATRPEIVGKPIDRPLDRPLYNPAILPELTSLCKQMDPVRSAAREVFARGERSR